MAGRTRAADEAIRAARRRLAEHAVDLREARLAAGFRQRDVARALGWSRARVGRAERGQVRGTAVVDLAAHASALGLVFASRLVPGPGRLRDAGQVRYINAYREAISGSGWALQLEARVGGSGDPRAIDLLLVHGRARVAHEFVTRLRDV
jgi:transcriptional regulator with XRE-family HTH domain